MADNKTVAKRLKDLRIEKGKSVSDVCAETGIREAALRNYECGIRIPNHVSMFTLAKYFGKSVDTIFFKQ